MRYPDGGGLSPAARERRETLRVQAARVFAGGVGPGGGGAPVRGGTKAAHQWRGRRGGRGGGGGGPARPGGGGSTKSAYRWRRRGRAGGGAALASTGPGGASCRLSDAQLQRLRAELERGPAEHGWADQRWTLARIATLIARLFHLRYTQRGTAYLLHRMGWSWQVPRHRAGRAQRGRDRRMAHPDLGEGRRLTAATGAWIVFEDEAGATLRPPKARTWAARGHTPQVAVSGRGGRVSMAALVCYRPGCRARLFYRIRVPRRRTGERRSFSEEAYAGLIAAAHVQLTAPIILIWDNLNVHRSAAMRRFCDAHADWLTVVQLPAYAPELNATEGVWAHVKRGLGNLLAGSVDELAVSAKRLLKRIQYRPELIDGFRAQTGLTLDPQPP